MRKTLRKRFLSSLLALLLLSLCSLSFAEATPEIPDLTIEDLQAMNGGTLTYTLNDDGYVTFLRGNYYDGAIKDGDDVEKALGGVARLLGADEDTAFIKGGCLVDDGGYRYYTFYQWQTEAPVESAIVKVIVDPDGQGVALSSSIMHGVSGNVDELITPEEALAAVKAHLSASNPETNYVYDENHIDKTRTQRKVNEEDYGLILVYVVYTNNPAGTLQDNGLAYLAHYVSAAGEYLYCLPVSSIGNEYALLGNDTARAFEGKTAAEFSGEVTSKTGVTRQITVPVMLDEGAGTYYLGDIGRKIIVADFWEYYYNGENVATLSSQTNDDWDTDALLAYDNYILSYDFFNEVGWPSTDGVGTPILLLTHYVDKERNPITNACYLGGNHRGWQVFAATSDTLNTCEALDVIGHEYTHGITTASVTQILYENQYGAINESLSDIMGNLIEMLYGRTDDTEWLVGETSGEVLRNMSDPNARSQPKYIGDIHYVPDTAFPSEVNDRGGVHLNNSLLAGVAPKLYRAGMTFEEERLLWTTFICALTPRTGYREINQMLPFAADIAGLGQHQEKIAEALSEIGMDNTDPFGTPQNGRALISLQVPDAMDAGAVRMVLRDEAGQLHLSFPDAKDNKIKMIVDEGSYSSRLSFYDVASVKVLAAYCYDGNAWTTDLEAGEMISVRAGEMLELSSEGLVPPETASDR